MEFQVKYCFKNMKGLLNNCWVFRAAQKQLTIFSLHWRLRFGTHQVCIVTSSRFFSHLWSFKLFIFCKIWWKVDHFNFCNLFKLWKFLGETLVKQKWCKCRGLCLYSTNVVILLNEQDRCSNSPCSVTLTRKASSKIISFMFLKWQWITSLACV